MKKFYVSPAIEVTAFVAEDILTASTIEFSGDSTVYDVVNDGIKVEGNVQTIDTNAYSIFGN